MRSTAADLQRGLCELLNVTMDWNRYLLRVTKKVGILVSWHFGMGIVVLPEAKMCTKFPNISIVAYKNILISIMHRN